MRRAIVRASFGGLGGLQTDDGTTLSAPTPWSSSVRRLTKRRYQWVIGVMVGSFIFAASLLTYTYTTRTGFANIEDTSDIHVVSLVAQAEPAASSLTPLLEPAAPASPVEEDGRQHREQPPKTLHVVLQPKQEPLLDKSVLAAQEEKAVGEGNELEVKSVEMGKKDKMKASENSTTGALEREAETTVLKKKKRGE